MVAMVRRTGMVPLWFASHSLQFLFNFVVTVTWSLTTLGRSLAGETIRGFRCLSSPLFRQTRVVSLLFGSLIVGVFRLYWLALFASLRLFSICT